VTPPSPDPCIASRDFEGPDARIVVRTSHFSLWRLGRRTVPVALPDTYTTPQGLPLAVVAPGVLGNDVGVRSVDPLTAVLGTGPAHGSLTLAASGAFTYTPVLGYAGPDSFTYRAEGPGGVQSAVATVLLNVTARPPTTLVVEPWLVKLGSPLTLRVTLGALSAQLTAPGGLALPGRLVTFSVGGQVLCVGTTSSNGVATCNAGIPGLLALLLRGLKVTGTFAGSTTHLGSSGTNTILG
jgi:hypothetical protein